MGASADGGGGRHVDGADGADCFWGGDWGGAGVREVMCGVEGMEMLYEWVSERVSSKLKISAVFDGLFASERVSCYYCTVHTITSLEAKSVIIFHPIRYFSESFLYT